MKHTAVEFLVDNLHYLHSTKWDDIIEQAKEMEKEEKIEFACQVAEASAEKYIQGKTTWEIAKDLLTFK
jgi:hypothetical protein